MSMVEVSLLKCQSQLMVCVADGTALNCVGRPWHLPVEVKAAIGFSRGIIATVSDELPQVPCTEVSTSFTWFALSAGEGMYVVFSPAFEGVKVPLPEVSQVPEPVEEMPFSGSDIV